MPMAGANFREGATPEVLLPRIPFPRTPVNKRKKKGPSLEISPSPLRLGDETRKRGYLKQSPPPDTFVGSSPCASLCPRVVSDAASSPRCTECGPGVGLALWR